MFYMLSLLFGLTRSPPTNKRSAGESYCVLESR